MSKVFYLVYISVILVRLGVAVTKVAHQRGKWDSVFTGDVLLSLSDRLMHGIMPIITECLLDLDLNSSEHRARDLDL